MTMNEQSERVYTDMQMAFLEALFNEAKGNIRKAMNMAGYSDNIPTSQIYKSLGKEITQLAQDYLAGNSAAAAIAMRSVLDDPSALGTPNLIKAASEIMNRAGVATKEANLSLDVPEGGLVILPAKNVRVRSDDL